MSIGLCGCLNLLMPVSFKGLMLRTDAPDFLADLSALSILGWFVPGFCPTITIRSALSKSSNLTVPFPMPMDSFNATPELS